MLKVTHRWSTNFAEFVQDIKDNPTVVSEIILDFVQEVLYTWEYEIVSYNTLIDTAYEFDIPLTIVTPYLESMPSLFDCSQEKYKRIKIIHLPTFWFKRTYHMWTASPSNMNINLAKNIDIRDINFGENNTNFNYTYICTNNIAKNHRCLVMDLLAKHNLIDCGAIAWRDISHAFDEDRHLFTDLTDSQRSNYPYRYWTPKRMFLDYDLSYFHQETVPDQFKESFMQLVTESDDTEIFFTEKTATPILLNKLFLVAGPMYHHRELNRLGFVNYDEVFDYSFDSEPDIETRYVMIIENIERLSLLSKEELVDMHIRIFPKLLHNKTVAMQYINNIPQNLSPILTLLKNESEYSGPLNIFL
jgi:hypothetical protein